MQLLEIFDTKTYDGFKTDNDDNSVYKLKNNRKTKLTLAQLNRLRIMNDVRKLEHDEKLDTLKKQYKTPAAEPAAM